MTRTGPRPISPLQFWTLAALGAAAVILIAAIALLANNGADGQGAPGESGETATVRAFGRDVDSVCSEFGIARAAVRARPVNDAAGHLRRLDYRVRVPRDFSTLEFNRELNLRVARAGARVQGNERTRDRTVTLAVLMDDQVLVQVMFELRQESH